MGRALNVNLTQNDPIIAVATTTCSPYRQADDQDISIIQNSNTCRIGGRIGDEPTPVRQCGQYLTYRQAIAFGRLRGSSGIKPNRLAKTLGRVAVSVLGCFRNRNRNSSTHDGAGPNRFPSRHFRKFDWRWDSAGIVPYFMDTTPTLRRRYSCAA